MNEVQTKQKNLLPSRVRDTVRSTMSRVTVVPIFGSASRECDGFRIGGKRFLP